MRIRYEYIAFLAITVLAAWVWRYRAHVNAGSAITVSVFWILAGLVALRVFLDVHRRGLRRRTRHAYSLTASAPLTAKIGPISGTGPFRITCVFRVRLRTFRFALSRGTIKLDWADLRTGRAHRGADNEGDWRFVLDPSPASDDLWEYEIRFHWRRLSSKPLCLRAIVTVEAGAHVHVRLPETLTGEQLGHCGVVARENADRAG